MRDPKRIEPMLRMLWAYWKQNPQLRLAQIVSNAAGAELQITDPYPMEDLVLFNYLNARTLDQE